jgi:hypothetical protein
MLAIILPLLIIFFIFEFTTRAVYGRFIKDEEGLEYINKYGVFSKNPYNHEILSPSTDDKRFKETMEIIRDHRYIALTKLSILSNYHISGMGRVFIWSKTHRAIKELYLHSKIDDK